MADGLDQWTVWLEEHGPALVLLARQWVARHADAEDVVQEAFVRFWRSRQRAADPAAYLYACVKNCASNKRIMVSMRKMRRRFRRCWKN